MNIVKRVIALTELLLVFPAALFMTALFVRNLQPTQYEPAHTAVRLVEWFAGRPRLGLGVLLIAFPLAALIIGCAIVLRSWRKDPELRQAVEKTAAVVRSHLATLLIAVATAMAGGILAIVGLHMITD